MTGASTELSAAWRWISATRKWLLSAMALRLLRNVLLLSLLLSAGYGAWLSDDYFIGLRQVVNFANGHGFSFYQDARVQTMTSPLWGLLLALVYKLADAFYAPLIVSVFLSMAALLVMTRHFWVYPRARAGLLFALLVLLASRAFMDFTSSGLENPLAYLFASLFCCALHRLDESCQSRDLLQLCLFGAILFLVRYDYALLVTPGILWAAWSIRKPRQALLALGAGIAVVLPWLAFSTIYYGSPFSNTYYAKITTQIPRSDLLHFGASYWEASALHDPVTPTLLASSAVLAASPLGTASGRAILLGCLAYCGYVTVIGGDFMVGRFFSVPVLMAAFVLTQCLMQERMVRFRGRISAAGAAAIALFAPSLPVRHTFWSQAEMDAAGAATTIVPRITDEKNSYIGERGLLTGHIHFQPWLISKLRPVAEDESRRPHVVAVDCGGLGWRAIKFGLAARVYDRCALADPFLSKLPLYEIGRERRLVGWGPGHFARDVPAGYAESLVRNRNEISDEVLAQTYMDVKLITEGPLFSTARWQAIWRLVSGEIIARAANAPSYGGSPARRTKRPTDLSYRESAALFFTECTWKHSNFILAPGEVLTIRLDDPMIDGRWHFSAQGGQSFRFDYYAQGVDVGHQSTAMALGCGNPEAVAEAEVMVPSLRHGSAFDRVDIVPLETREAIGVGGLYMLDSRAAETLQPLGYDACNAPGSTGTTGPGCSRTARAGVDPLGHVVFGPYVRLAPGKFEVAVHYGSPAQPSATVGQWDVVVWAEGKETTLWLASLSGTEGKHSRVEAQLDVPVTPPGARVEVRVFFPGTDDVTVDRVEVRPR